MTTELKPPPMPEPDIDTANHAGVRIVGYTADQIHLSIAARDAQWLALVGELQRDAERLDLLEAFVNEHGAIHLHDGEHPYGLGLGLRPGSLSRTLREAIDSAIDAARGEKGGV